MPNKNDFWPDDIVQFMSDQAKANEERIREQLKASGKTGSSQSAENQLKSKKLSLQDRLELIKEHVTSKLGIHKNDIQVIRDEHDLESFITRAINNGVLAYDTETNNSLDYLTCKVVGICIYTPGLKAAYVPVCHEELDSNELLPNQISKEYVAQQIKRAVDAGVKFIMHNGKFDYQVTKCYFGIAPTLYWDTMVGCRMINENDEEATLKWQYHDKCDPTHPIYDIDEMFPDVPYIKIDPDLFVYYAAVDALMTYELYLWQKAQLETEEEKDVLKLFTTVEMPLVIPVAEMELRGVLFDSEYCARLEEKYRNLLHDIDIQIEEYLETLRPTIQDWREKDEDANYVPTKKNKKGEEIQGKSKSEQLEDPINLGSPTQLAILIYDILKVQPVNPQKPRSTDKKILKIIAERDNIPFCVLLNKRRAIDTLLTDFISKLPGLVRVDGAIHGSFNQCGKEEDGVVTGRFSSSDPNMQNIPSHNVEIRPVFMARPGYVLMGADFKAQEPRLTAYYSQDENMLEAYRTNKDLYAVIASAAFDNKYEDNLEFYPEGTEIEFEGKKVICGKGTHINEAGKARRGQAKTILLGILYGRGAKSIGEQIGKNYKQAQAIIDKFFESFPRVKEWIDSTHFKAENLGYVEDWYGRKRHLPQINLPRFEVQYKDGLQAGSRQFNPILSCKGRLVESDRLNHWLEKLQAAKRDAIPEIIRNAKAAGILVTDNTGIIAKAERQSVNSIVQGGAATLTKMAMRDLYYDPELQRLGYHMLITVHDEVLGECPKENIEEVEKRVYYIMTSVSKPFLNVPMDIDADIGDKWYINNYISSIEAEFKDLQAGNTKKNIKPMTSEEAYAVMLKKHTELTPEKLHEMLYNNMR